MIFLDYRAFAGLSWIYVYRALYVKIVPNLRLLSENLLGSLTWGPRSAKMIFLLKQVGGGISKGLFVHLERSSTSGFWSSSSHLFSSKLMQPANIETTKENPHGSEVLRGATSWENAFNILLTKPWTPEGSSFSGKTCVVGNSRFSRWED